MISNLLCPLFSLILLALVAIEAYWLAEHISIWLAFVACFVAVPICSALGFRLRRLVIFHRWWW